MYMPPFYIFPGIQMDDFCPCIHASASGPAAVQREQVFQGFSSHVLLVVPPAFGFVGTICLPSCCLSSKPLEENDEMASCPPICSPQSHSPQTLSDDYEVDYFVDVLPHEVFLLLLGGNSTCLPRSCSRLVCHAPSRQRFSLVSRFSSRTSSSSFFLSLCSATGLEPSMLVPLLSPRFCVSVAPPCSVPGCGGFGRPLDFHCATTCASSGPVGIGFRKLYWILSLCGDFFMSKFMCARSLSSWCNWFLELWLCCARRCTHRTEHVPAIRDTSPSRVWQSSAPQQMFDLHFWKSVPASL